jgi:HlyD family secretion protein
MAGGSILADRTLSPTAHDHTPKVDTGEVVVAGAPLLELVDLDHLYLKVYVPEVQIGKLRLDLPARIYTDAFPDQPFDATVRYIASKAEFTPKEVQTPDERVKLIYAVKLYLTANSDHRWTPVSPRCYRWHGGGSNQIMNVRHDDHDSASHSDHSLGEAVP